jgi:glutathione peroxidase
MESKMEQLYNFSVSDKDDSKISMDEFKGKVLLIVNTASKCGFTPQYEGLNELHQKYHDRGFSILAFPCNQFGKQEPGSNAEIQEFCSINFDVSFPVMAKIDVNGENEEPLFTHLKSEQPGIMGSKKIKWNFTKFLVDQNGKVLYRFAPKTTPAEIEEKIKSLL